MRVTLYFLVLRDIKILYKQTVLGFTWAVIRPLFSMIVFSIVFGKLAKVSSDGVPYPIFNYTALVPWTYFSTAMRGSVQSLVMSINIFTKVYFPRIFIPLTPVLAKLVDFVIAFCVLIIMMFGYRIYPTFDIIYGRGISWAGDLLDLGASLGLITKSGTWFRYGDTQLGQGRENARRFLEENQEIAKGIETAIREHYGLPPLQEPEGIEAPPAGKGE